MEVMTMELALLEVKSWLDCKKISQKKRDVYNAQIESIADAFVEGVLILSPETKKITHKLKFPIEDDKGNVVISELVYKPRLRTGEVQNYLKGMKSDDGDGRVNGYVAALAEQPIGIIKKMDTEDNSIASSLVVFFG